MVKLKITNLEVTIEILYINKTEKIEIKYGKYRDNPGVYTELVIAENKILLQGDDTKVIATSAEVVNITIKSSIDKLVEHFQNPEIYFLGVNAIPEEKMQEALRVACSF